MAYFVTLLNGTLLNGDCCWLNLPDEGIGDKCTVCSVSRRRLQGEDCCRDCGTHLPDRRRLPGAGTKGSPCCIVCGEDTGELLDGRQDIEVIAHDQNEVIAQCIEVIKMRL